MDQSKKTRGLGITVDEMILYHSELVQEKGFLTELLSKIDGQLHALQVEQLQLLNSMNAAINAGRSKSETQGKSKEQQPMTHRPLDLSVPISKLRCFLKTEVESEEEDEEDE